MRKHSATPWFPQPAASAITPQHIFAEHRRLLQLLAATSATASIAPSRRLPIDGLVVIGFLLARGDTACRAADLDVEW